MRTRIVEDAPGWVTVTADNVFGQIEATTYFVNAGTGPRYVRVWDDSRGHPQVCEMLAFRGNTLMATRETLLAVIRREWRRMRDYDRRGGF
jgi:hypothetical protein